jgi:prepilin-type N-terminal cleavage/methylation domain-containing protein/prepilin-type processing-associated H-X9-DG protein
MLMRRPVTGFTLIEVLVVVAIIALLVAILLPSLAAARAQARSSFCTSNLHQTGIAVTTYAHQHQDYVPRGGNVQRYWSHGDIHWTIVLLRHVGVNTTTIFREAQAAGTGTGTFNGRSYEMRGIKLNELLWRTLEKTPVFQCPERARDTQGPEAISYIVNAFNPDARLPGGGGYIDVGDATRLSVWKFPSRTIYVADLEKNSVSTAIASAYPVSGTNIGDLSFFDAFEPAHLPSGSPGNRRVARAMHLQRRTNSLFVDGHVEPVDSLPRVDEAISEILFQPSYRERWLSLFGVKDP